MSSLMGPMAPRRPLVDAFVCVLPGSSDALTRGSRFGLVSDCQQFARTRQMRAVQLGMLEK